jgi:hypothetical protein
MFGIMMLYLGLDAPSYDLFPFIINGEGHVHTSLEKGKIVTFSFFKTLIDLVCISLYVLV